MPRLITITKDWGSQPWYSTGGTRAKKYLQAPDGKFYYFKRSQSKPATGGKPAKDFKFEFWSEIIAYQVGALLGFDVLRYDIAIENDVIGCISESMINPDEEELIEGVKYLQAYDNEFNPELKKHRIKYTFQLIEAALSAMSAETFKGNIVEIIIFDAIIGNSDLHQENWAFINQFLSPSKTRKRIGYRTDFAPFYDNGSSLGRELTEEKVLQLINSEAELASYLDRGMSEIHWNGIKISHFELVQNLLNSQYHSTVRRISDRVFERYEVSKIEKIIRNIDEKVPDTFKNYRIPNARKKLILKIITLRLQKLRQLINEGI